MWVSGSCLRVGILVAFAVIVVADTVMIVTGRLSCMQFVFAG